MTVSETVLVFAVIPALIMLVVGGLAYLARGGAGARRYRPGRPYDAAPVWFLAAEPDATATAAISQHAGESIRPAGATGGASDRW